MKTGIFITGTDTGVGKTYVACGIAAALRAEGIDVGVMKPAETGCRVRNGRLVPSDSLRLKKAAGAKDALSLVNPYRFRKPLAPAVAAELEGREVDIARVLNAYAALSRRHDFMIVEGAGGILVPLTGRGTFLDLAESLRLPVLVVARPHLGTINHTLLTVSALRGRGVPVAGIVINYPVKRRAGPAEKTSPPVIAKMSGANVLGVIPFRSADFRRLASALK